MPLSKKTKRKPGRPRKEKIDLAIEIIDWDWNFMFGIQTLKGDPDPYFDYRYLNIRGVVRGPDKFYEKPIEISCSGSVELNERNRERLKPIAVGAFSRSRGALSAQLRMPADAIAPVLQMLIANRYRFIIAEAAPFERNDAMIQHYYFSPGPPSDDIT